MKIGGITAALRRFVMSLMPQRCLSCDRSANDILCDDCMKLLALEGTQLCKSCNKTLILCDCIPNGLRDCGCVGATSAFTYSKTADSVARKLILKLKTHDDMRGFELLASLIAPALGDRRGWLVTYVPRRRESVAAHGFDQAERLARSLANALSCDLAATLKRRGSTVQKDLSYAERHAAASNSYEAHGESFVGRRVILVDDIVTTGATLSECTKILLEYGAESVYIVTVARAVHEVKEENSTQ